MLVDRYGRVWLGGLNTHGQLGTEERLGVTDESRETRENPAGTARTVKTARTVRMVQTVTTGATVSPPC